MPDSIEFYKRIFLHAIYVRIIVPWLYKTNSYNKNIVIIAKKLDFLDKATRKITTEEETAIAEPGVPKKIYRSSLIGTIYLIEVSRFTADNRKQSVVIRTIKAVDDLTLSLFYEGFELNIFSFYLRLVLRNSRSIESKTHVHTASVKWSRPESLLHKSDATTKFVHAPI